MLQLVSGFFMGWDICSNPDIIQLVLLLLNGLLVLMILLVPEVVGPGNPQSPPLLL